MTYGEVNNYIAHVSDNDLVALCKSVYEFKNGNGVLEPTSTLKILAENLQFSDIEALSDTVTEEAHKRYKQIVLLLMKNTPAVDTAAIIRCKNCDLWNTWDKQGESCSCAHFTQDDAVPVYTKPDDFCSYAEIK